MHSNLKKCGPAPYINLKVLMRNKRLKQQTGHSLVVCVCLSYVPSVRNI